MSRMERLKTYSRPLDISNWAGQSTQQNIDRWSARTTRESDGYKHRAKRGEIELPGGGDVAGPSYGTKGGAATGVNRIETAHATAKRERNHAGSSTHMRGVKRHVG